MRQDNKRKKKELVFYSSIKKRMFVYDAQSSNSRKSSFLVLFAVAGCA
jgi:hypothetical protein